MFPEEEDVRAYTLPTYQSQMESLLKNEAIEKPQGSQQWRTNACPSRPARPPPVLDLATPATPPDDASSRSRGVSGVAKPVHHC